MPDVRAVVLEAAGMRLEPLAAEHREDLARAANHGAIWVHMPLSACGADFDAWFDLSMTQARTCEAVWAVRTLGDGKLVGSTRYLNIDIANLRVEVGYTWYEPAVWATLVNPACKFALFQYGFESVGLNRIELKTDGLNTRSQAAIAKLGAVREGVLRSHMIRRDGTLRDSVYFSVVRPEWPAVRRRLAARLGLEIAASA